MLEQLDSVLEEGRGLVARSEGEVWQDKEGKEITFEQVILLPEDGTMEDTDSLQKTIQQTLKKNRITLVKTINTPTSTTLACMIAVFTDSTRKKVGFLKYFNNMSNHGFGKWRDADFTRETGFSRGQGTVFLEKLPIKPADLITDEIYRPPVQVMKVALQNAQSFVDKEELPPIAFEHLKIILTAAVTGKVSPILKGGKQYSSAYDKYLGEILAPISVVTGWLSSGDRAKSEKALLNGGKYRNALISFSQSKNERLVDSNLALVSGNSRKPKVKIGISSKAGSGAAASVTTFAEIVKKLKGTPILKTLEKKYEDLLRIIETIDTFNQFDGPPEVAKILGLLSSRECDTVKGIKGFDLAQIRKVKFTKNLLDIVRTFKGSTPLDVKNPEPNYRPDFHIISGVAKVVALKLNEDSRFDELIRELLNYASMVQVNSKMMNFGEDCQFVGFDVKWPPVFEGKIVVNSDKNYSAARINGKISFKIK